MTKHNEDIVREVLDTLYEAEGAILGVTALDTELEMRIKIQQNECATTRRIDRAISAIQQLELDNPWHKASEELPKEDGIYIVMLGRNSFVCALEFDAISKQWSIAGYQSDVKYWMPIPEIEK